MPTQLDVIQHELIPFPTPLPGDPNSPYTVAVADSKDELFEASNVNNSSSLSRGLVLYNGNGISDANVHTLLFRVALALDADIVVTGGDRDKDKTKKVGGSKTSHHLLGRAVDFHVAGMTDEQAFGLIRRNTAAIFDVGEKYQVIRHGVFTETTGAHLHIGHYPSGSGIGVTYWVEGLTKKDKGKYTLIG